MEFLILFKQDEVINKYIYQFLHRHETKNFQLQLTSKETSNFGILNQKTSVLKRKLSPSWSIFKSIFNFL